MGIIRAFTGAIGGTFADQWKDIIIAGHFDEYTVVGNCQDTCRIKFFVRHFDNLYQNFQSISSV